MNSEFSREINTVDDLLKLNAKQYCDLGPGNNGYISIALKNAGKNVVALDAPWDSVSGYEWAKKENIKFYFSEFFTQGLDCIEEPVDCFILAHSIAHFRHPPQLLFEKIYNKLPAGGYFYLSTVNVSSLQNVMSLFRGQPITGKVNKLTDPGFVNVAKSWNNSGNHLIWDDWMHVKEYTIPELKEMLQSEKFKVVEGKYRNNFRHWKQDLITKVYPQLSEEIIMIAQK